MPVQNVRDFPETTGKLDSELKAPFHLNEHGNPNFFQVFAKKSLIKNIFEVAKKLDSTTFFWKIVPYWVYFVQGEDFKQTTELSKKVQYSLNPAIKKSLNEASNAYVNKRNFTFKLAFWVSQVTKTQFCVKVIQIFNVQLVRILMHKC